MQYIWLTRFQMGGMRGLEMEYGHQKPIELNETNWYPIWYEGDGVASSRVEAWEFVVGGGASFNHLNGLYTPDNPTGNTPDNTRILPALTHLRDFMYSFDFLRMSPDRRFVRDGLPPGVFCRGMSEPGRQYALYYHHSRYNDLKNVTGYIVEPGEYADHLLLDLPGGNYRLDWVDPATGKVLDSESFVHQGGDRLFNTPAYTIDIALRIKRV